MSWIGTLEQWAYQLLKSVHSIQGMWVPLKIANKHYLKQNYTHNSQPGRQNYSVVAIACSQSPLDAEACKHTLLFCWTFPKAHMPSLKSGANKVLPARICGVTISRRSELFLNIAMSLFTGVKPQFANEDTAVKMENMNILISLLFRRCLASESIHRLIVMTTSDSCLCFPVPDFVTWLLLTGCLPYYFDHCCWKH